MHEMKKIAIGNMKLLYMKYNCYKVQPDDIHLKVFYKMQIICWCTNIVDIILY